MVFSTNQVRQLYVALANGQLTNAGDIKVNKTADGKQLYFTYVGALGDTMRSDLIDVDKITSITIKKASDMAKKRVCHLVTLDSNINSGNPVTGQDYILRLLFRQYVGMSEANTMNKYGEVHINTDMSASDFYKKMAISIVQNCSKDINNLVEVELQTSSSTVPVSVTTREADLDGTYTGILLYEGKLVWRLGRVSQGTIPFECQFVDIVYNGDEVEWGKTSLVHAKDKVLPQGELIADLEYFCMGERGDIYRNMGWPNAIETKYLVDPTKLYNIITIHYHYEGTGLSSDKSEKDIQIAAVASSATDYTLANAILGEIKTITGSTVAALS